MSDLSQFELINASIQQAVDAINHALVVYDANERFRFCNRRHREWYAPIADLLTPGRPLEDILHAWYEVIKGELVPPKTADEYVAGTLARHRRAAGVEVELQSLHRWIAVAEHRMPDGGVVAVRRDITHLKQLEADLRDRELVLRDVAELSYNWYWRQDERFRYVRVSDGIGKHGSFDRQSVYGKTRWELGAGGVTPEQWAAHRAQLERHETFHDFTYLVRTGDGERRWFSSSGKPLFDGDGTFIGYHGIGRDITERMDAEKRLRESEARFKALTEMSADWYWEQDAELRFTRIEGRALGGFMNVGDVLGKRRWEVPNEPPAGGWAAHIADLHEKKPFRKLEYVRVDEEGNRHWISVSGEPIVDRHGTFHGYRGVTSDVTARKNAEQKLEQLARYDDLTGLANRHLLVERIQQGIALAQRENCHCAVLFIDLDRVRRVNNTLGHIAGDALLTEIAMRIMRRVRETDTVGRRGGDEFIVVLPMISEPEAAAHVAKGILQAISEPLTMDGAQLHVTASIGISVYPEDGEDQQTLIRHADAAMYFTKAHGRNGYHFYTSSMHERVNARLGLEASLRTAIEDSQFKLLYQAQRSLRDGRITGFEALLRWNDPARGELLPGNFIEIAEETGLILQVGEWALYEACRAARRWTANGREPPPVAVNISALQFQQANLPDLVRSVLADTGLPPHRLELEMTETSLMRDSTAVLEVLDQLRESGISIAIDDFGSGYSSLGYLKRFPIDKLKIDRTFISRCAEPGNDAAIAAAIIALGHALNLTVVAEGVETQAQLDFLKARGCTAAQGYLIAPPVSGPALDALLAADPR